MGVVAVADFFLVENIILTGQLICQNAAEIALVAEFLPQHIELTRSEPGCISFEVVQTGDPKVWDVAERFTDALSFERHQARIKASEWGHVTAGIKRSYTVLGL